MRKWVDLRKNNTEVRRMLEKIEVYQQPSGFVDNVIFSWITQAQAEHTACSFEQRDLFASPISEDGKAVAWLSHQIQVFIAGKMSAALQLTDTHFAFLTQASCRISKENIKKEMRQRRQKEKDEGKCEDQDGPIGFRAGPYDILRVAFEAHEYAERINEEKDMVMRGQRENFFLSYRPNLSTGGMERCDTQVGRSRAFALCPLMPLGVALA